MKPRDYQLKGAQALKADIDAGHYGKNGGVLCSSCTGSGKTIIQTIVADMFLKPFPDLKILFVTASAELVWQNYQALLKFGFKESEVGIYCAQLNKKQFKKITVGTIQSLALAKENEYPFVKVPMIFSDETHQGLFDHNQIAKKVRASLRRKDEEKSEAELWDEHQGLMRRFLARNLECVPNRVLIGFSGTPERAGNTIVGTKEECQEGKYLYSKSSFEVNTEDLIKLGYLKKVTTYVPHQQVDISNVRIKGGEYDEVELGEKFCALENVLFHVKQLVAHIPTQPKEGQILVFCVNVAHIDKFVETLNADPQMQALGFHAKGLHHLVSKADRKKIIDDFKHGRNGLKVLVTSNIASVGFDMDNRNTGHEISLIMGLSPTKSAVRYRQREIGRSVRPFYSRLSTGELDPRYDLETVEGRLESIANSPIPYCYYLSYDGNPKEHSAITGALKKADAKKEGLAPTKQCPRCAQRVATSLLICDYTPPYTVELADGSVLQEGEMCGFQFPPPVRTNEREAFVGNLFDRESGELLRPVEAITYEKHHTKSGFWCLRVNYAITIKKPVIVTQFVSIENPKGRWSGAKWWVERYPDGVTVLPLTVDEVMTYVDYLREPTHIKVKKSDFGYEYVAPIFSDAAFQPQHIAAKHVSQFQLG